MIIHPLWTQLVMWVDLKLYPIGRGARGYNLDKTFDTMESTLKLDSNGPTKKRNLVVKEELLMNTKKTKLHKLIGDNK